MYKCERYPPLMVPIYFDSCTASANIDSPTPNKGDDEGSRVVRVVRGTEVLFDNEPLNGRTQLWTTFGMEALPNNEPHLDDASARCARNRVFHHRDRLGYKETMQVDFIRVWIRIPFMKNLQASQEIELIHPGLVLERMRPEEAGECRLTEEESDMGFFEASVHVVGLGSCEDTECAGLRGCRMGRIEISEVLLQNGWILNERFHILDVGVGVDNLLAD